jgi:hypothetical protein
LVYCVLPIGRELDPWQETDVVHLVLEHFQVNRLVLCNQNSFYVSELSYYDNSWLRLCFIFTLLVKMIVNRAI